MLFSPKLLTVKSGFTDIFHVCLVWLLAINYVRNNYSYVVSLATYMWSPSKSSSLSVRSISSCICRILISMFSYCPCCRSGSPPVSESERVRDEFDNFLDLGSVQVVKKPVRPKHDHLSWLHRSLELLKDHRLDTLDFYNLSLLYC